MHAAWPRADGSALDQVAQQLLGAAPLQRILGVGDGARLAPQFQTQQSVFERVKIRVHFPRDHFDRRHRGRRRRSGRRFGLRRGALAFALRLASLGGGNRRRGRKSRPLYDALLAQKQSHADRKDRRKPAEQNPFFVADARRSGFNRRVRARARAGGSVTPVGLVGAGTARSRSVLRRRRCAGNRDVHSRADFHGLFREDVVALFLPGRGEAGAGNLHRGRNDEQHALRVIRRVFAELGLIAGVRQNVGDPHTVISRLKRVGDGVAALAFVDRALAYGHSRRPEGRDLVEFGALRNREFEIAVLLEVGGGGIRIILNGIFLADHQLVAIRLEDQQAQRNLNRAGIRGGL